MPPLDSPSSTLPERFCRPAALAVQYGSKLDYVGEGLSRGDPMADEVVEQLARLPATQRQRTVDDALLGRIGEATPPALRALLEFSERVPFWFEEARANRGGQALLSAGW